jgi:probable phosphoglycerate mutase
LTQRLVLLRHGRTAWNASGRFQGHADPPLDPTGWAQGRRAAVALAALRPSRVVTSDLARARATAALVADACAAWAPPEIVVDPALREVDLGAWEGLDDAGARRRFPAEYQAWRQGAAVRRGGGETEAEAGARAAAALVAALAGEGDGATVVAVSHGLVLRAALRVLAGDGVVPTGDAPHLANGEWVAVTAEVVGAGRATLVVG